MERYCFLEGEKVYLRPFQEGDEYFFSKWFNDKEICGKIGQVTPTSLEDAKRYVNRNHNDSIWFAVVRKEDDVVIGETGLLRMFAPWRTTDLTIIIPNAQDQGKGYGTETIHLLLDYAFGYLNYNRVAIGVVGFNHSALEFYKKVGFQQEGIQEQGYYYNYQYHDFIMMRLLKQEFIARHQPKNPPITL